MNPMLFWFFVVGLVWSLGIGLASAAFVIGLFAFVVDGHFWGLPLLLVSCAITVGLMVTPE